MDPQRRRRLRGLAGTVVLTGTLLSPVVGAAVVAVSPAVAEYSQLTTSTTPPTQAQCASVNRRCFSPAALAAAYDLSPLYAAGLDGTGQTIAIVDSYGSDTMAHDLHVFNTAFGLRSMCGEEGVVCA